MSEEWLNLICSVHNLELKKEHIVLTSYPPRYETRITIKLPDCVLGGSGESERSDMANKAAVEKVLHDLLLKGYNQDNGKNDN